LVLKSSRRRAKLGLRRRRSWRAESAGRRGSPEAANDRFEKANTAELKIAELKRHIRAHYGFLIFLSHYVKN
jgi:hypothetical protein